MYRSQEEKHEQVRLKAPVTCPYFHPCGFVWWRLWKLQRREQCRCGSSALFNNTQFLAFPFWADTLQRPVKRGIKRALTNPVFAQPPRCASLSQPHARITWKRSKVGVAMSWVPPDFGAFQVLGGLVLLHLTAHLVGCLVCIAHGRMRGLADVEAKVGRGRTVGQPVLDEHAPPNPSSSFTTVAPTWQQGRPGHSSPGR